MKTINEHIKKNTFVNYYLLYGEEDYLIKQCRDNLVKALLPDDDGMNYMVFRGKNISQEEIVESAETLPFFAERRVIVVEDSGYFKSTPEFLLSRLEQFPESTYFIFVDKEVDKRSKFYKKIKSIGYDANLSTPDARSLMIWVKQRCKMEQIVMGDSAIAYFVEHMGSDMSMLSIELEKLFCYCMDAGEITVGDIDEICVNQEENKIFEMMDAIGNRQQGKALALYHDLLDLREPSMKTLFVLTRQFRILMIIRGLADEGVATGDMASKAEIPPFTVKKYIGQIRNYTFGQLKNMVERCQETEAAIKTGRMTDVIGVELLIVEFSS